MADILKPIAAALMVIFGYFVGYWHGEETQRAVQSIQAAQVAAEVSDLIRRSSDALYGVTTTLAEQNVATTKTEENVIETIGPDTCAIDADRLLQLDRIR